MELTQNFLMLIWLAILLIGSAFFSGAEVALLSLSKFRVKQLSKDKPKAGKNVATVLEKPDSLIGTILVGNNMVNVAGTALATGFAISFFGENGIIVATAIMTLLLLVFSEITPKTYAAYNPEKFSLIAIYPIRFFIFLFYPIVRITTGMANFLLLITGSKKKSRWSPITEEDIESLIEVGEEEGSLEPDKGRMLSGVFDLSDLTVENIMIPMKDVVGLEAGTDLGEMERIIIQNPYSRYPIYEDHIDHVVGYVHAKEFFKVRISGKVSVKDIIHPPLFVPESKTIYTQLRDFQKERAHLVFVVDEYGEVRGIITLEDIIEEITGEIYDESDRIKTPYVLMRDGSVLIETDVKIRDINRLLNINLPSEDNPTLGALILKALGHIPERDEELTIEDYKFKISAVKDRTIVKVKMEKKEDGLK